MNKINKKNILSVILMVCMMFAMTVPALADDSPIYYDENGIQIGVEAKITGITGGDAYCVEIAWGDMKFEYSFGGHEWNPDTHSYDSSSGVEGWNVDLVNGDNNHIGVRNHSNLAITVDFEFEMNTAYNSEDNTYGSQFNGDISVADAVVGGFYESNTDAVAVFDNDYGMTADVGYGTYSFDLESGVGNTFETSPHGDVFFALSGTPGARDADENLGNIGEIYISISPYQEP